MSDSEEEGFHKPVEETTLLKGKQCPKSCGNEGRTQKQIIYKSPLCIHHEIRLREYPRQIDCINVDMTALKVDVLQKGIAINIDTKIIEQHSQEEIAQQQKETRTLRSGLLLSEALLRRMTCVYKKFRQNLLMKRDLTILIRNISLRVKNEALTTFDAETKRTIAEGEVPKRPGTVDGCLFKKNTLLKFDSAFECGNLHSAFYDQRTITYYLCLQNDINTHGYTQWFYFSVSSLKAHSYHIIVINISKPIYHSQGSCLFAYSLTRKKYLSMIPYTYYPSKYTKSDCEHSFFCIDFQLTFKEPDQIFVSLALPYTYSKIMRIAEAVDNRTTNFPNIVVECAGKSEIGNTIVAIRIKHSEVSPKKMILVLARQHPSETVSSFICQQILNYFTDKSNEQSARQFLAYFSITIVPIVNPDGVIHGHSRTNLNGYDLNRCWQRTFQPKPSECATLTRYIENLYLHNTISHVIDQHGHSRATGYFAYFSQDNQYAHCLSYLMSNKSSFFSRSQCLYEISGNKKMTLRGWAAAYSSGNSKIPYSITIQTSLFGFRNEKDELILYSQKHFKDVAHTLLYSILYMETVKKNKLRKELLIKQMLVFEQNYKKSNTNKKVVEEMIVDSDSDPEEDYLALDERNIAEEIVEQPVLQSNQPCASEHEKSHSENKPQKLSTGAMTSHRQITSPNSQSGQQNSRKKTTKPHQLYRQNFFQLTKSRTMRKIPNQSVAIEKLQAELLNIKVNPQPKKKKNLMEGSLFNLTFSRQSKMTQKPQSELSFNQTNECSMEQQRRTSQHRFSGFRHQYKASQVNSLASIRVRLRNAFANRSHLRLKPNSDMGMNRSMTQSQQSPMLMIGNFKVKPHEQVEEIHAVVYPTSIHMINLNQSSPQTNKLKLKQKAKMLRPKSIITKLSKVLKRGKLSMSEIDPKFCREVSP